MVSLVELAKVVRSKVCATVVPIKSELISLFVDGSVPVFYIFWW